jgi:hypothetical protein
MDLLITWSITPTHTEECTVHVTSLHLISLASDFFVRWVVIGGDHKLVM